MRFGRNDCDCPSCAAGRSREPRGSLDSVADLAGILGPKEGSRWFARLAGREAKDKLEVELERWLAGPGSASRMLWGLSAACRLGLALLVEARAGLTLAELEMELVELGGSALAASAVDDLASAGFLFTIGRGRPQNDKPRVGPDSWLVLPSALRSWLAPVALPLLFASAEPPHALPAGAAAAGVAAEPDDPGMAFAIGLASLRTVGARTTGARLYKKDRERIESLSGAHDADELLRALTAQRLVRLGRSPSEPVEVRWSAVERWASLPVGARAADDLSRRHGGTLVWQTLVDARGDWVEEIHLARRSRMVTSTAYARGAPDRERRRQAWARERLIIGGWPEVEIAQLGPRSFFRLRPELAAALRAAPGDRAAGSIFVQPDFEVLVPRDAGLGAALLLARVAALVRADVVLTFKLTAHSVRRAVLEGLSAARIVAELGALASHGVPAAVERAVHDWAGNVGRCTVDRATLARFDDESLASRAALALGKMAERVGPTTLVITDDGVGDPEDLLEKAGFPPRMVAEDEDGLTVDGDDDADEDDHSDSRGEGDDIRVEGVAAMLGLRVTSAEREIEGPAIQEMTIEVQTARAGGASAGGPGRREVNGSRPPGLASTKQASHSRRAAVGREAVSKLLARATQADADVVVVLNDGSNHVIRPLPPFGGAAASSARVRFEATGADRDIAIETIASALALYGTSRGVSRNQPCPCGSGRKFKRCCGANGADTVDAQGLEVGGTVARPGVALEARE